MSDDEARSTPIPERVTIGPPSLGIPDIPGPAPVPNVLQPEERRLFELDPTAPRWAMYLAQELDDLKTEMTADITVLRGQLREQADEKAEKFLAVAQKLVDHLSQHATEIRSHDGRLDRQRTDIGVNQRDLRLLTERYEKLNDLAHENHRNIRDHGTRLEQLEKVIAEEILPKLGGHADESDDVR